ncbi:helix-turn-helix domain-containing protein [Flagellimonas algicola]|uniref:Helix-turn-helix transcriptional regulator n=1 Tax=Flagellimonas algicola TaxID=2583815 RepID=A0ABY2WQW5_9FLAO|nr:helix-turn-helix transcriptional regulator [Allomuricauda algicola]TMU57112.1 helix-turn-helix transcriptional regulator [Allomuricauda algicola]
MTGNTNIEWAHMTDSAIVEQLGRYIRRLRLQQDTSQAQLAEKAGLNRWTISKIENGEPVTLMSLIQILRALNSLYVLDTFQVSEEISPLAYAKLKKQQKQRASGKSNPKPNIKDLGW